MGITSLDVIDPCDVLGFEGARNPAFSAAGVMLAYPMANGAIASVVPPGSVDGHTQAYPTERAYVFPSNAAAGASTVLAPATGRIVRLDQAADGDWKIVVQVDTSFYYFLDHITPFRGVTIGSSVLAGQGIARNSGLAAAVDFGVYNFNNAPLTGILNRCMAKGLQYADSPIKYYSAAAQQVLYSKIATTGTATKFGKFDYDASGKLVGNWVLAGSVPISEPDETLAFVYNVSHHGLRISMGSSLSGGVYAVQPGAKDFSCVTQATGQMNYRLFPTGGSDSRAPGAEFGVLAVQVLPDGRIKVELFPGNLTGTATFTDDARTYER